MGGLGVAPHRRGASPNDRAHDRSGRAGEDGDPIGFANFTVPDCQVDQLYVDPVAGGRGVARLLLATIRRAAEARGLERLDARASWRAVPVFERFGYRRVALELARLDGETLERVLMCLDLR